MASYARDAVYLIVPRGVIAYTNEQTQQQQPAAVLEIHIERAFRTRSVQDTERKHGAANTEKTFPVSSSFDRTTEVACLLQSDFPRYINHVTRNTSAHFTL